MSRKFFQVCRSGCDAYIFALFVLKRYHDWEHFSSVRNLAGPHDGIPDVVESPPPGDLPEDPTPKPPSSSKPAYKPKSKPQSRGRPPNSKLAISETRAATPPEVPSTSICPPTPAGEVDDQTMGSRPSSRASSSSLSSAPSPITPTEEASASLSPPSPKGKGRSPKRSIEDTEDGGVLPQTIESGRVEAKRRSRESCFADELSPSPTESPLSPPSPSPQSTPSSRSSSPAPTSTTSAPQLRSSTRAVKREPILTRRQRKKLGLPKSRSQPQRVVLTVQGSRPGQSNSAGQEGEGSREWIEKGVGRLDVRGFRELKI